MKQPQRQYQPKCAPAALGAAIPDLLGALYWPLKLRKLHARENPLAAVPPLDGGGDGTFKKGRTAFQAASAAVVACISRGSCGVVEHFLK